MTKKKAALSDFITARESAQLLTLKHGRIIRPGYIHKIRGIRSYRVNKTCKLYSREDIQAAQIRQRAAAHEQT